LIILLYRVVVEEVLLAVVEVALVVTCWGQVFQLYLAILLQ
jgi:hypothetical protein